MQVEDLTDEQIAKLTPEQITILEREPERAGEFIAQQEATGTETKKDPEQEGQGGAANGAGDKDEDEQEPVVLNKSGKGVIPYEQHKGLRIENARLRERIEATESQIAELQKLREQKEHATTPGELDEAEKQLQAHMELLKEDLPEVHDTVSTVHGIAKALKVRVDELEARLAKQTQETERERQRTTEELVAEAKENNPELLQWEQGNAKAWTEAMRQDELLRYSPEWADKTYDERFAEVVRRVQAIYPETKNTETEAERTRKAAQAKLEAAKARKPTTLSDMQGGSPASVRDEIDAMDPLDLAKRLMKMSPQEQAAMRAEID